MEFVGDESRSAHREIPRRRQAAESHGDAARNHGCGALPAGVPRVVSAHESVELVPANAGDHKLIHALLRAVHQAPSYEDFITWLDDPTYEPPDRLLVKQGARIVAHVQVLDRLAWFHGIKLPVGAIQDLVALPEYRESSYEQLLLEAAERSLGSRQAVVAFTRTDRPEWFRAHGWSEVLDGRSTEANVADVLANLAAVESKTGRRSRSPRIRLWRHVELDSLRRVYYHAAEKAWGAIDRSEPYWRWLVGRKAHDELIVAIHGRDHWYDLEQPANIVGYAVTRGSQLVELCMLPGFEQAGPRLLVRACRDAIEQDHRTLSLRLPASDALHEVMIASGGHWVDDGRASGRTLMVKLLDPARWVECIYPLLQSRGRAEGISRPYRVTFDVGEQRLQLELTRRSGRLTPVDDERADDERAEVRCTAESLAALLVGNLQLGPACDAGAITVADAVTAQRLAALFPPERFWQSPFDLLRF